MNRQERRAQARQGSAQQRGGPASDLVAEGVRFHQSGQFAEAEARYCKALALAPKNVDALHLLGVIAHQVGRHAQAVELIGQAIALDGRVGVFHQNVGAALVSLGRLDEAIAHFEKAIRLQSNLPDAHANLASALMAKGQPQRALRAAMKALALRDTPALRRLIVSALKSADLASDADGNEELLTRALEESWDRPYELSMAGAHLVKRHPAVAAALSRIAQAWPTRLTRPELFDDPLGFDAIANHRLLRSLLVAAPVADPELERLLATLRGHLVEQVLQDPAAPIAHQMLEFHVALAQQCFINEYIYAETAGESAQGEQLRQTLIDALDSGTIVSPLLPVAVASIFPLGALPGADRLLQRPWPAPLTGLLRQQVVEPRDELASRGSIPRLTTIDDQISVAVREQYEENPYPRWVRIARDIAAEPIDIYLRNRFPLGPYRPLDNSAGPDILIAGCGTGQQPLEVSQQFSGARVLAIDLSLSSLAYARRKALELGLVDIEFAQADILKLGTLERSFDVIESVGVLHHLDDPMVGWQVLLSRLRPGGLMRLGFYSEAARQSVVAAREFIARRGYGSSIADIRQCRQDLWALGPQGPVERLAGFVDFYSTSACRDLIFHVQEHRLTLPQINAFLAANNLTFIGFDIHQAISEHYLARFPADRTRTNLENWHVFESERPDTFAGMYQFWVQKA